MTKAKTKKTKKTKQQDVIDDKNSSPSANQSQPTSPSPTPLSPQPRRSLLPHNMTHEINLLKDRVASLESLVKSLLNTTPKSAE